MAHRGASDELPENTLAAFRRALEQGADVLETDIRFTRDDELILMHDATVNRTTNGTGVVAQMTLREIKKLSARSSPLHHPEQSTAESKEGEGAGGEGFQPSPNFSLSPPPNPLPSRSNSKTTALSPRAMRNASLKF